MTDDQTVPGEHANYEDYNFARAHIIGNRRKWFCHKSILSGTAGRKDYACIIDTLNGRLFSECQGGNEGADEPIPVDDDEVNKTIWAILDHHILYGCNRLMDKIEFVAPKELFVRCKAGSEPQYQYNRPSKCYMCEETGMTKEYGCAYFKDDHANHIDAYEAANWDLCTAGCMQHAFCESAFWEEDTRVCTLSGDQSVDTADKTCSHTGVIGGRKCHAERECEPLVCDMCAAHGFTLNEGSGYEIKQ